MRNDVMDDWEGFDSSQNHYDARKERKYHSTVWWVLSVISIVILLSIAKRQYDDHVVVNTYNVAASVEVPPYDNGRYTYVTNDNITRTKVVPDYDVLTDDEGRILMYYQDPTKAEAIATGTSWIKYYVFFGIISALSIWRLVRVYKSNKALSK